MNMQTEDWGEIVKNSGLEITGAKKYFGEFENDNGQKIPYKSFRIYAKTPNYPVQFSFKLEKASAFMDYLEEALAEENKIRNED